jgi:hypothetical protein
VAAADLNGDGWPDLIVANGTPRKISALANLGSRNFGAPQSQLVDASPIALAVGDFNGNGRPDTAVVCAGEGDYVVVLDNL